MYSKQPTVKDHPTY